MQPIDFHENIIWHKFKNGRTLVDFVVYKGVAMWWTTDEKFFEFLYPLLHSKNKKQQLKKTHILIPRIFGSEFGVFLLLILDVFLFLLLNFILIVLAPVRKGQFNKAKPLLVTTAQDNNWRVYRDYLKNQKRKADYFLEPMIPELSTFVTILGIYPIQVFTKPIASFKKFVDRIINWNVMFKPFRAYWSPKSWLAQKKVLEYTRRKFKLVLQDEVFKQKLIYDNISYAPYILKELAYVFLYLIPLAAGFVESSIILIEKNSPSIFLIMNEYSLWERSLLIAAKHKGIPVIAIQHGEIPRMHRGYIYSKKDISPVADYRTPFCPIPDKIAVYGEYYRELLTEKSFFPKDVVVVTGQPRYDIIYFIKQKYKSVSLIRKAFGLPVDKKILLWTTQTHGMPDEENRKNIETVYSAMKDIPDIELVIKLHPNEDQNAPLYKENTSLHPKIIGGQADTFLLLHASDIAMTKSSTTGLEAIAFEKPLIILNLSGNPDTVDFVSEGVAVGVYNPDPNEFKNAVLTILAGKMDLSKNRERYIRQKLYKIDAKASHRVVKIVREVLDLK